MKVITFYHSVYEYFIQYKLDLMDEYSIILELNDRRTEDEEADILISGTYTEDDLKRLPNIKYIIVPYTGMDGLDLELLRENGITPYSTSAHASFVAERALALLLALRSKVVDGHMRLLKNNWSKRLAPDRISWKTLFDKRIAIYGYGHIGQVFASLIRPFNVAIGILSYKGREFDDVVMFDCLEDMASWCDVLVVTAPLNESTENSVDEHVLALMDGKMLINVGRGKIINEKGVYEALKEGRLDGFASDVWYTYPSKGQPDCPPSIYPFGELDNVVMTPHNAGNEVSSRDVRYEDVFEMIVKLGGGLSQMSDG